jgi:hypothetical protein
MQFQFQCQLHSMPQTNQEFEISHHLQDLDHQK